MKILGIDPGTGRLGWAIVSKEKSQERLIECGCLETKPHTKLEIRLLYIHNSIHQIIKKHKPDAVAIEDLFFAKNTKTAMDVGAARGVVILTSQQAQKPIFHYTPLQVKSSVTGFGRADKKQIQYMITKILNLKEAPQPDDASDAVAIALTHLSSSKLVQ